jgi:hypothetical protein
MTDMPEASFREVCDFLEVPFEPAVLKLSRFRPHMTGSTENAVARNERRAQQYFSPTVLKHIESIAGKCLTDCGYRTLYKSGDQTPNRWKLRFWELTDDRRRLRETFRTAAGMQKSGRWSYLTRRLLGALRQKSSLHP